MMLFLLGGLLTAISFPPRITGLLLPVMLFPWFRRMLRQNQPPRFRDGFLAGLVFFSMTIGWIACNSGLPWTAALGTAVLAVLYLSAGWGVVLWISGRWQRRFGARAVWTLPLLFGGFEYITTFWDMAFPWPLFGQILAGTPWEDGVFGVVGVYGATVWLLLLNLLVYQLFVSRSRLRYTAGLVLLLLLPQAGEYANQQLISIDDERQVSFALVQPAIDSELKWEAPLDSVMNMNLGLVQMASDQGAELIILPESAAPCNLNRQLYWQGRFQKLADKHQATILVGALARERNQHYNSVYLFSRSEPMRRYDKRLLVPFGERFPFQDLLPSIGSINLGQAEFTPGTETPRQTVTGQKISAIHSICFEGIFSPTHAEQVRRGGELLINMTNDAWYSGCREPEQHFLLEKTRTFETGRPLLRVANSGVTAFVNARGKEVKRLREEEQGILYGSVAPGTGLTLFLRGGENIMHWLFIVIMILVPLEWLFPRRQKTGKRP